MITRRNFFDTSLEYLEKSLKNIGEPRNDQIKMVKGALNSLIHDIDGELVFPSIAQIIEAPNGAGKAAVMVAVALAYAKNGKKVLILEPNKLLITEIEKYFKNLNLKEDQDYMHLKPYRAFDEECKRLESEDGPKSSNCKDWRKKCIELDCIVKEHLKQASQINIILSTHHKMIYDRTLLEGETIGKFDLVMIDEFHMIPEVVASYVEKTITIVHLEQKLKKVKNTGVFELQSLIEQYKEINELGFRKMIVKPIFNKIKELKLQEELLDLYGGSTRISTSAEGITINREINEIYLENTQFLLFSATVIDGKEVIYNLLNIDGVKIQRTLEYYQDSWERLQRITILGASDLPRLGKSDLNDFNSKIQVTIDYLIDILLGLEDSRILDDYNVLVLCNSHADANNLKKNVMKTTLKQRLLDVDEIQKNYELKYDSPEDDAIATLVGKEVEKLLKIQKRIILVTGSSVFWQGINLEDVQFLFVLTLPYRKPTMKELKSKRGGWSGSYSSTSQFKYMVRRLSQGIGRLCRKDFSNEEKTKRIWGIAVILDGRIETIRSGLIKRFPKVYRTQFNFYTRNKLKSGFMKVIKHIAKYNSPYSQNGQLKLEDFFG